MISSVFKNGNLIEQWNDEIVPPTYTRWNDVGAIVETRSFTTSEQAKIQAEKNAASRLSDLESRVSALEKLLVGQIPDPPSASTPVWKAPCPPNAVVRWPNASSPRYRNVSGAFLVANPTVYPIGYVNLDVTQVPAWTATPPTAYAVGNQVTYLGSTWQCLQAHTSQVGWAPGLAPSLWVKVN